MFIYVNTMNLKNVYEKDKSIKLNRQSKCAYEDNAEILISINSLKKVKKLCLVYHILNCS